MRLPNTRQNDIVFKILKDIVWIEPMKTKLVQGVYCRWMAVKLKSKNDRIVHNTCYSTRRNFISKHCKKETSYPANVEVNSR